MKSHQDDDTLQPLTDTWRWFKYAASWTWMLRDRPSGDEAHALNAWRADQLAKLLDLLRPIARVRGALFSGPPGSIAHIIPEQVWSPQEESHLEFERKLLSILRTSDTSITSVGLECDIYVWVRTSGDQNPVRGWVRNGADVDLQLEAGGSYGVLSLAHTLFRDGDTTGEHNTVLHRLNNPLLKKTLEMIEVHLGAIEHVEGLPDVTRSGFKTMG